MYATRPIDAPPPPPPLLAASWEMPEALHRPWQPLSSVPHWLQHDRQEAVIVRTSSHSAGAACADKGTARLLLQWRLQERPAICFFIGKKAAHMAASIVRGPLGAPSALCSRRQHGSRLP